MLVEVLVFGGDNGISHELRNLVPGHDNPAFQSERADDLPIISVNFGDKAWPEILQGIHLRKVAVVDEKHPRRRAQRDGETKEENEDQRAKVLL